MLFRSPYRVIIEQGALDRVAHHVHAATPGHRVAIITDAEVGPRYASRIIAALATDHSTVLTVPSGEQLKTRETWASLTDQLLAKGFGRDTTIVALGGGVVGDLAGFVAAAFITGWLSERGWDRSVPRLFVAMGLGHIVILAAGFAWLAFGMKLGVEKAWLVGIAPFVAASVIKNALGAAFVPAIRHMLERRG